MDLIKNSSNAIYSTWDSTKWNSMGSINNGLPTLKIPTETSYSTTATFNSNYGTPSTTSTTVAEGKAVWNVVLDEFYKLFEVVIQLGAIIAVVIMYFKTIDELKLWLIIHKKDNFDGGSQGECFKVGDKVYKIFIQFIDDEYDEITEYDKTDIMQFSSIINNTYIWPNDTIMVGDIVVGYITNYVDAKQLCNINPLRVDLDKFDKNLVSVDDDIKKISDNGVKSFDVMYNILYGKVGFKIIDSLDYSKTDMNSSMLYKINCKNFYYGIRMFLVYGIFEDFVFQNKSLE